MKRFALLVLVTNILTGTLWAGNARQSPYREDDRACRISDMKEYYGHKLSTKYDTRRVTKDIAGMLYEGPLMRKGDEGGVNALAKLFDKEKIEIREVGDIVRGHLYGESDEFHDLFKEQQKKYDDEREAAFKILDKIYEVFGYRPYNRDEEDFDVCLIRDRKADYVVTKVLVDWMERRNLR
jgi:hypothetical protein